MLINTIAIAWISFAIVLFTMPTAIPVTPITMSAQISSFSLEHDKADSSISSADYASVVFAGFTLISAFWYAAWGRSNYRGPKVSVADMGLAMDSDEGVVKKLDEKVVVGEKRVHE